MNVRSDIWLNVGGWLERSVINGPGERFVLWLQGCPILCKGCFNQNLLPFVEHYKMTVEEVAQMILSVKGIEGVTYSGGEPIVQAKGLYHLSSELKEHGLTVVCYTGYTLEQLQRRKDPWIERLLSHIDILIDGPYVESQKANLPWRGSRNQRVHFLTETYRSWESFVNQEITGVEFVLGAKGLTVTGIWQEEFLRRLKRVLEGG